MKTNFFPLLFVISTSIFITSCGSEPQGTVYDYEKADSLSVEYERELRSIRKDIKDAGNLYLILREIEVPYNSELVKSPGSYSGASGRKKQALSLGAAGADLNYITMFEQGGEAQTYVKTILDLAGNLGIQSAFDEEMMNSIIDNSDTTMDFRAKSKILTDAYRKAEDNLYSEERAQLVTMIVAGGWLESMYIASSIGAGIEAQREVDAEIWNMVFGVEKVIKMLNIFADNSDCAALATELKSLQPIVDELKDTRMDEVHAKFEALNKAVTELRDKML